MVYLNPWRIMLLWFTYDDSSSLIWQVTPSLFLSLVTDCHTGLPKVEKYSVNHWSDKQVVTPLLATLSSLPASEGANHLSSYRGRPPPCHNRAPVSDDRSLYRATQSREELPSTPGHLSKTFLPRWRPALWSFPTSEEEIPHSPGLGRHRRRWLFSGGFICL